MEYEADVCIVGSGFAGTLLAQKLIKSNIKVVLLESGIDLLNADHLSDKQFSYSLHTDTLRNYEILLKNRWLGGHSNCWGGTCLRLPPELFDGTDTDGKSKSWPLSYSDLEPYYHEAENILCPAVASGNSTGGASVLQKVKRLLKPEPNNDYVELFNDVLKKEYQFRQVQSRNSKLRLIKDILPQLAKSEYFQLISGATVLSIKMENRTKVKSLLYQLPDGSTRESIAKYYVIACGAIESPRLLLLSKSELFPKGIGNDNNCVGRYYTDHFTVKPQLLCINDIGFLAEKSPFRWDRHWFSEGRSQQFFVLGTGISKLQSVKEIILKERVWGSALREMMDSQSGAIIDILLLGGFETREENFVELDVSKKDWTGRPIARIKLSASEKDILTVQAMEKFIEETHKKLGLKKLSFGKGNLGSATTSGGHLLCTCRMGETAKDSVVDKTLRVHGIENLFISGGAVFSTAGEENPTLTISALTLRLGDYLRQGVPS